MITVGSGTQGDPWVLKTPPQSSAFRVWHDEVKRALVVQVGTTKLSYHLRCIKDLHGPLQGQDRVALGNADEDRPVHDGSVEAWARDEGNPLGGYYGLRKGYRGRSGNCVPPVLELLGLAEVDHNARGNRMRAR